MQSYYSGSHEGDEVCQYRDNDGRVSWQSGTAETEEDSILGIEYHFFGNGAIFIECTLI